jgi:hypothetical protein
VKCLEDGEAEVAHAVKGRSGKVDILKAGDESVGYDEAEQCRWIEGSGMDEERRETEG